ncbi:MAG: DUF4424 family protein [Aquabacterium sp.]|uniref:DUF4424 family protein n=1 Tax=Aquabacterium sp. TaxID=1872578 RepID=UPI001DACFF41|nr:DUF4424 family protein [Aquabacterium sp.]MBT9609166.1 DUF4424 family protein [Aquabacterium sp.]|tara:strand:- start:477 stop:1406 length:930 start_codon:yes stop_codon:yes gene_type:complete
MLTPRCEAFFALLLVCAPSFAWDNEQGYPAPELDVHLPAAIKVGRVKVAISEDLVEVTYPFTNQSAKPVTVALGSITPAMGRIGLLDTYPDHSFTDMQLKVDGHALRSIDRIYAFQAGRDITSKLTGQGVDPLRTLTRDDAISSLPASALRRLKQAHLIAPKEEGEWPLWRTVVARSWTVRLKAGAAQDLVVRYVPRPSRQAFEISSLALDALTAAHCAHPENIRRAIADQAIGKEPAQMMATQLTIPVLLGNAGALDIDMQVTPPDRRSWLVACDGGGTSVISHDSALRASVTQSAPLSLLTLQHMEQ